jgi:cysteine desulfuration protein SufE
MTDHDAYPAPLAEILDDFDWITDRRERSEMLIHYADQFEPVPARIAARPFDEDHRVPACESEAFVWVEQRPDGTLGLHFAVENPQGISAKAMAAILDMGLSGQPPEAVATVSPEIVFELFGNELSMGKGQGLTSMVAMVQAMAKQHAA